MEIKIFQTSKSFLSFNDILNEISSGTVYKEIDALQDPHVFFSKLTVSLINSAKVVIGKNDVVIDENIIPLTIGSIEDLIERLKKSESKVGIFTSGTTGKPKLYFHSINSLIDSVKYSLDRSIVWACAYSFNHIAFLKVYLQAMLNGHLLVSLYGLSMREINSLITELSISNISGTPTFYRLLDDSFTFSKVRSVTMGGERFVSTDMEKVVRIFPNAKVRNIYASTEAGTLLTTDGEFFEIQENERSKIRIIDGTIHVNRKHVSEDLNFEGEWYNTGDAVEYDDAKGKYRILGRKSEVVNIGGENVSFIEVESKILTLEYVRDIAVKAVKNSVLGNILKAEVLLDENYTDVTEEKLHADLTCLLPNFMIPRIVIFVNELDYTTTLKKKR
jgi:acyl-coenzyme A synthetase/AMP-(fatty) acid ligase